MPRDGVHRPLEYVPPVPEVTAEREHDRRAVMSAPHDRPGGAVGGGDPDRVRVRRDLVDPDAPRARRRGQRGDRGGRRVVLRERPRLAVRLRRTACSGSRLREAPTSTGKSRPPIAASSGRPASSCQLCASGPSGGRVLAEPEAGVEHDHGRVDALGDHRADPLGQLVVDLADHVSVDWPGSTCRGCARASASTT